MGLGLPKPDPDQAALLRGEQRQQELESALAEERRGAAARREQAAARVRARG